MRFLIILVLSFSMAQVATADQPRPTITVTGSGEVAAEPDMATVTLGVVHEAKTAAAAMGQTSGATARIIAALRDAGVDKRDMQTSGLSLDPLWANRKYDSDDAPRIDGFVARNTLSVRVRDMDRLGGVLDQVLQVGANNFQGLTFGVQEPGPLIDAARIDAVQDAARKAALLAEAAGVTLGPVLSMSEGAGAQPRPVMMMEARAASVPVAAGEVSLTATVTMVFAIGD